MSNEIEEVTIEEVTIEEFFEVDNELCTIKNEPTIDEQIDKGLDIILDKFGEESQLIKVMEEMAELTQEICRNIRGKQNREELKSEIADVYNVVGQLEKIQKFTKQEIKEEQLYKVNRCVNYIKEDFYDNEYENKAKLESKIESEELNNE